MLKPLKLQVKSPLDWIEIYKQEGALFVNESDHILPHPVLRSGRHSNGFFNSDILLQNTLLVNDMCWHLLRQFNDFGLEIRGISRTVGPAMGAITLAHHIAFSISGETGNNCLTTYASKKKNPDGSDIHEISRNPPLPNENILLIEDVITSGGSIAKTAAAVERQEATVLPFVVCLVNRSGKLEIDGRKIISLVGAEIESTITTWEHDSCEMCQWGSKPMTDVKQAERWRI